MENIDIIKNVKNFSLLNGLLIKKNSCYLFHHCRRLLSKIPNILIGKCNLRDIEEMPYLNNQKGWGDETSHNWSLR